MKNLWKNPQTWTRSGACRQHCAACDKFYDFRISLGLEVFENL